MKNYNLSRTELSNMIEEYVIGKNAIRDREIMKDRLIDGYSYYELCDKYNLALPTIKCIVKKRTDQIFLHYKG